MGIEKRKAKQRQKRKPESVVENLILAARTESKGKYVKIISYNGGLMKVPLWGLIAIDLNSLNVSGQVKLLVDHNSTLSGLVGYGKAKIAAGQLIIEGKILDNSTFDQTSVLYVMEGGVGDF